MHIMSHTGRTKKNDGHQTETLRLKEGEEYNIGESVDSAKKKVSERSTSNKSQKDHWHAEDAPSKETAFQALSTSSPPVSEKHPDLSKPQTVEVIQKSVDDKYLLNQQVRLEEPDISPGALAGQDAGTLQTKSKKPETPGADLSILKPTGNHSALEPGIHSSSQKRSPKNDCFSTTESYVSTLPPDSDCTSEESDAFRFSVVEDQPTPKKCTMEGSGSTSPSPPLHVLALSQGVKPKSEEKGCTTPPGLEESDGNEKPHLGTLSRRSTRLAARQSRREDLAGLTTDSFHLEKTLGHASSSAKRKRGSKGTLPPSSACIQEQRKLDRRGKGPSRKRPLVEALVDGDSDSVEIVQVSVPVSSKKARPFQNSSIVPDWVPSNGLQSISRQFMEDEPWNVTPKAGEPSSSNLVPKSILLPAHSKPCF
jgi:hypothetical protein